MHIEKNVIRWTTLLTALVVASTLPNGLAQRNESSPFSIFLVPARSQEEPWGLEISMAADTNDSFYVILTNISKETQSAFEGWCSWGYYAISFEMETGDGRKFTISKQLSKKQFVWTRNWPAIFLIPPGESMICRILLDDYWGADPDLPIVNKTPIPVTIRAIYQLDATPESAAKNVWTGRLESLNYNLKFRHWISHALSRR
ncbi:MAG: hypothetical protein JXA73_20495 [Acidobacteria bacterium]|nr:hypothetical protein [Acidobacteriota bacterium]